MYYSIMRVHIVGASSSRGRRKGGQSLQIAIGRFMLWTEEFSFIIAHDCKHYGQGAAKRR